MPRPDDYYPVNTIPPIAWAFDLYFKYKGKSKTNKTLEITFPAGEHKEKMQKRGRHELVVWFAPDRQVWVRAKCTYSKDCSFNSDRINGRDRDLLKTIDWSKMNQRQFFPAIRRWLLQLDLDFVLFIRALNTICDRMVNLPLTTQYGKTFERFNDYRRIRWPKEATPENPSILLESLLIRVAFWFQSAAIVGALKVKSQLTE